MLLLCLAPAIQEHVLFMDAAEVRGDHGRGPSRDCPPGALEPPDRAV